MFRAAALLLSIVAAAAGALEGAMTMQQRAVWRRLHAGMSAELRSGSLTALLRARGAAQGARIADPGDGDLAGEAAFLSAWLAHSYGLGTGREAAEALRRAEVDLETPTRRAAVGASRALLALQRGERESAARLALAAADGDRNDIRPLLALGRARAWAGDLAAASAAFEAAGVKAPGASAPLVAWAEARLDLGEPAAAAQVLGRVLASAPEQTAARLLLEEARQALALRGAEAPAGDARALAEGCARDSAASPVIAAGCALARAEEARTRGDRVAALREARAASAAGVAEPRLLARAALLLASLGLVDEAEAAAARAEALAAPVLPALQWARAAIALGRGEVARAPALAAAGGDAALVSARAALASGGPEALGRALPALGEGALRASADLRALATLVAAAPSADASDPVRAWAAGLRARLAGDPTTARRLLAGALDGHGDACRAAGEYVAALDLAGEPLGDELGPLRAANRSCVNLAALPPPLEERRRRVVAHSPLPPSSSSPRGLP